MFMEYATEEECNNSRELIQGCNNIPQGRIENLIEEFVPKFLSCVIGVNMGFLSVSDETGIPVTGVYGYPKVLVNFKGVPSWAYACSTLHSELSGTLDKIYLPYSDSMRTISFLASCHGSTKKL
ncbi:hypothetical protein CAPTEDRAFT_212302 [Capitella teleta]|uniref:Uncharacterized protein n=1 Tax=Capitella teleta TaxID=283909 RepID=R7VJ16_CAPTE|nr:hypothetical protein CAPTEDRAFT_212302 [Capitella teleta]|eukprot:ELU16301.1 hypothetical protein CAPTEDRAFT_212302 [Capitella teleta]